MIASTKQTFLLQRLRSTVMAGSQRSFSGAC
jgi:hypothetical protein